MREARPKALHPQVRALIDAQGRRYEWVASQMGLTPDRFAHIIDGRRPAPEPTDDFYLRLARLLGVSASHIRPHADAQRVAA